MLYVPAGVPAGTEIRPVAGFSVGTGAPGLAGVAGVNTDTSTFAKVTGAPFSVSPSSTFSTSAAPVAPFTPATLSGSATIGAATTVTEIVAVWQFVGFAVSQIV